MKEIVIHHKDCFKEVILMEHGDLRVNFHHCAGNEMRQQTRHKLLLIPRQCSGGCAKNT